MKSKDSIDEKNTTQMSEEIRSENTIYANDFYDSSLTDSQIIDNCLNYSAMLDERVIVFDTKDWHIDEAVLIPSNTTIIVDGVTIKQNDEVFDNIFRGDNLILDESDPFGFPLSISKINNIKLIGINGAKLEGPDVNRTGYNPIQDENQKMVGDYWGWRGFHICLSKASDFEICGFVIRKTRSWAISMDKCHNYKVHDLDIVSDVKNGDGVNNRAGCHDLEIYNITGSTSDDTVAMTAIGYTASALSYPRGTYIYPLEPSQFENMELGAEELSIRNGKVYNINTTGKHHGVICLAADGLQVRDIFINNIHEPSASTRESVVRIYSGYGTSYSAGDLNRIRVNDIVSKGAKYAVQVTHPVEDVWFNKIVQENENGRLSSINYADGVKITNS